MFKAIFFFSLVVFSASIAKANVSLKNGNFFMGYSDLVYPGGFEPKVERVYNSKTPYNGFFGWGWGNEYEVYLKVSADGSVVVHEYGGGAQNRFTPQSMNAAELDKAIVSITEVARKAGIVGSAEQLKSYQAKLRSDASFRNDEWQKFVSQNKIKARELPEGSKLQSVKFAYQTITKTKEGYTRVSDSGRTEFYNNIGKLIKVIDNNKNFSSLSHA
jgi:hypothetical protein